MKALTCPESHRPRSMRRVPKPVMEKRRRERINQSLETLRLLMLDNTQDEKLKNPKVEKAEILESVVNFLKMEKDHRSTSGEQKPKSTHQHSFQNGMRSCLLRVSRFIASKSQELEGTEEVANPASLPLPDPETHTSSSGNIHMAQATSSLQSLDQQHCQRTGLHCTGLHCDTRELLSPVAAFTHISDPVWRPWPQ
ncbi:hairy-related 5 [Gasterosteus aculeatus]|uniref:Hairy-related 5 n=1 Tax=Gasterosteus aculeatus aculeatus TaxID=481459 RepID=G3Q404_GASAC|nr:hairy-related 5 [Gasterosteus aculeatus aculeatus]